MQSDLLPLVSALLGAFVGGIISLFEIYLSSRGIALRLRAEQAEKRAQWAVEYELTALNDLYVAIGRYSDSVEFLRISYAWDHKIHWDSGDRPSWVPNSDDAYEKWDKAYEDVIRVLIRCPRSLATDFQSLNDFLGSYRRSESHEEMIKILKDARNLLYQFRSKVFDEHSQKFDSRLFGKDLKAD